MAARDQFIMERYLAGEIVSYDLPLRNPEIFMELNREIVITGILGAEFIQDSSHGIGLFPYNDCIHWVHDGQLKGGALVQPISYDSEGNIIISARGWSTMLDVPIINGFQASGETSVANVIQPLIYYANDNVLNGTMGFFVEMQGTFAPLGSAGNGTVISSTVTPGSP